MREHEQFFGVESQRLAETVDQPNRRPAVTVLDVRDVAGFDADSCGEIALRHSRFVTGLFNDSAECSFTHPCNSP